MGQTKVALIFQANQIIREKPTSQKIGATHQSVQEPAHEDEDIKGYQMEQNSVQSPAHWHQVTPNDFALAPSGFALGASPPPRRGRVIVKACIL